MAIPERKLEADIVVIGGGIIGSATAYYLAQRKASVVLVEKSVIGGEASGNNLGGVRAQSRDYRERPLAKASIKIWESLKTEFGFDVEYIQGGNILPAINEKEMAPYRIEYEQEIEDGLPVELWDQKELRKRAPYIGDTFIGAKYCRTDGVANPLLASRAFGWAANQAGAKLLIHTEAVNIVINEGKVQGIDAHGRNGNLRIETPLIVHAGGIWTPLLSEKLGIEIPMTPIRHVVAVTQRMQPFFSEYIDAELYGEMAELALKSSVGSIEQLGIGIRPARNGQVHIGGISKYNTFDQSTPADAIEHIALGASILIPALKTARIQRAWARPLQYMPDMIPVIGPVDGIEGYILATGFSGHGFCLGPIVGKLLSELILDGEPSIPLDDFGLSRFVDSSVLKNNERLRRKR